MLKRDKNSRSILLHCCIGSDNSKILEKKFSIIGNIFLSFDMYIFNSDVPIILSINSMHLMGVFMNNSQILFTIQIIESLFKVNISSGHPFISWNPISTCFFIKLELPMFHRRSGHHITYKLFNLLQRSERTELDVETGTNVINISIICE